VKLYTRSTAAGTWTERDTAVDSITITDEVNARSTATATILDSTGVLSFPRGTGIKIERGNVSTVTYGGQPVTYGGEPVTHWGPLFVGFIMQSQEGRIGIGGVRRHQIEAVDLHYLLDKRIVTDAYQNATAGDIVNSLITTHLTGEGVTAGLIQSGPTIRAITFDYITVADALSDLAARAGFWWRVNPDASLDFAEPIDLLTLYAGSVGILSGAASVNAGAEGSEGTTVDVETIALADSANVQRHAKGYRNRQWVKGGQSQTVIQVETQYGDGEKRAIAVGFPVAKEPTVEISVSGGAWRTQTVGAAGIQTGQWLWSQNSVTLKQDSSEAVLTSADRVRITYTGLFNVIAKVDDEPAQNERETVEGGTGIVENVLMNTASDSQNEAIQLGGELLEYWTPQAVTLRFATMDATFYPGDTARFTLNEAGIVSETGLVQTVEHFTASQQERVIVTVVIGPREGDWVAWFGHLSRRIDRATERAGGEVEIVTSQEAFSKTWTVAERPNIFTVWYPGVSTYPGATPVAAFRPEKRVTHLAWYEGGTELGRKAFTVQTGEDTTEIVTTTVLVTTDAVGDIDEFAWFGGDEAGMTLESGVEVDRQAFVTTKTDIEMLQVVKADTRW